MDSSTNTPGSAVVYGAGVAAFGTQYRLTSTTMDTTLHTDLHTTLNTHLQLPFFCLWVSLKTSSENLRGIDSTR